MRVAAWSALAAYVAITVLAVELVACRGRERRLAGALGFAGFAIVGALIALRQPRNAVGWLLLAARDHLRGGQRGRGLGRRSATRAAWQSPARPAGAPTCGSRSGSSSCRCCSRTGGWSSPRWRPVLWLAVLDLVLSVSSAMLKPGPLELQQSSGIDNPLGVEGGLFKTLADIEVPIGAAVADPGRRVGGRALPPLARRSSASS